MLGAWLSINVSVAVQVVLLLPSDTVKVTTWVSPWVEPNEVPAVGDCVTLTEQLSELLREVVMLGTVPLQLLAFILMSWSLGQDVMLGA